MPFLVRRAASRPRLARRTVARQGRERRAQAAGRGRSRRRAARAGWLTLVSLPALLLSAGDARSQQAAAEVAEAAEPVEVTIERPTLQIGWTGTPPSIDGQIDPDEWRDAALVDGLTQATPDEGEAATQRTQVWVMTDEDNLYVAARLWDTNPEQIVASAMARDASLLPDDRFGFAIDPFLDRQNGYFFQVNPNGARRDFLIEGGRSEPSWDGRWYARASVDDEGWTVEIALPYATINFDPNGDVWGFNMARGIRRRNEIDRWADPVRERFILQLGNAGNLVGMTGIRQGLGLRVVPATTVRRVDDVNDPIDSNDRRHYTRVDPSLDVFYKITPSLTTAITANTDFGETEVDERQVNLTRFALFFPEKRDFFLQDALIFDFGEIERNGRPFFSRRIGLDDDGNPQGLTVGGKVTGRVDRFKLGLLNVLLDDHDQVDDQNVFVSRAAANFGESSIGGIITHGDPEGMSTNTVAGADFIYRNSDFMDRKSLRGSAWLQASVSDPDTGPNADQDAVNGTGFAYGASLSYPNDRTNWEVEARVLESDFFPALGFVNRVGIRQVEANYRRRWRPTGLPGVQTIDSRVAGDLVTNFDGNVETGDFVWTLVEVTSPINDLIRFQYAHRYEFVETAFDNFDVDLGRYHFDEGRLRIGTSENRPISGRIDFVYGDFYDGTRFRTRLNLDVRFTRYVQLGVLYSLDELDLPGGDETIHLLRARMSLFFTPDISWVTLAQYDNVSETIGVNSRFRWIIEDGRELFLVLNQGFDASDGVRAVRTAPLVKLEWTFRF